MAKLQLSPTRISTFLTCKTLYKYDYQDKIGRFYHKGSRSTSFGATLHQALHGFAVAGGVNAETAEQLTARAMESWRSLGYDTLEQENEYKELAEKVLITYHANSIARGIEANLFLAEKQIKFDMGEFVLTGRVDRIDEHIGSGVLEVIDYKSGRETITEDDVSKALAMCVYQLILKRAYPDRRVQSTIVALRSGDSATVELSDEQLAVWEDDLRDIGRQILETDWESVRPVWLPDVCPDCDYLKLCERYWKITGERSNT
jgi:putative RecB family exonuclease